VQKSALDSFFSHYPESVLKTLNEICLSRGMDIYLVGGALRDLLMNVVSTDLDFAVSSGAAEIVEEFRRRLGKGSVVVLGEETNDTARLVLDDLSIDVAGYRKGARTIEQDLVKRDFTINSLGVSLDDLLKPEKEVEVVDPFGGFTDLTRGVVRACPGCFDDDPLRLLRAYRFGAQLGFYLDDGTAALIKKKSSLINAVAAERISFELDLIMASNRAHHAFNAMAESTLLSYLMPELCEGRRVGQPPYHHLDVMDHNLAVLDGVERIVDQPGLYFSTCREQIERCLKDRQTLVTLKWAALLHDIGKPAARKVAGEEEQRITFHSHDEQGAVIARQIGERWKWSRQKNNRISALVAMHMHPFHLNNVAQQKEESISKKAMHKICKRAGDDLCSLFILAMADSLAGQGPDRPAGIEEQVEELFDEILRFKKETLEPAASGPKLLTGHDLIDTFGLEPGPELGRLLDAVETAVVEGLISTREDAIDWVEKQLVGR
jgi:poly(A) polymerase